jgi:hypothetical protein
MLALTSRRQIVELIRWFQLVGVLGVPYIALAPHQTLMNLLRTFRVLEQWADGMPFQTIRALAPTLALLLA